MLDITKENNAKSPDGKEKNEMCGKELKQDCVCHQGQEEKERKVLEPSKTLTVFEDNNISSTLDVNKCEVAMESTTTANSNKKGAALIQKHQQRKKKKKKKKKKKFCMLRNVSELLDVDME